MARNHRIVVYVDDTELFLLQACQRADTSLPSTVRTLALKQAEWFASKGLKTKPLTKYPGRLEAIGLGKPTPYDAPPGPQSRPDELTLEYDPQ